MFCEGLLQTKLLVLLFFAALWTCAVGGGGGGGHLVDLVGGDGGGGGAGGGGGGVGRHANTAAGEKNGWGGELKKVQSHCRSSFQTDASASA